MRFAPTIRKPVVIEDDVWIGTHAVILPGVTVGRGSVIGANSVVTKDVKPYSIVIGSPARHLKFRDTELAIEHDVNDFEDFTLTTAGQIGMAVDRANNS